MLDWSDIGVFLTVCRSGSFTTAARTLGVDQTTVGRRVTALEATLRTRLFRRGRDGLVLTPAGVAARVRAERMEEEALALGRAIDRVDEAASGPVRLTTLESIASRLLAPRLPQLLGLHPGIRLALHVDNRALNLNRREADVAIRLARPVQEGLVARRLAVLGYAAFASEAYLARRTAPRSVEALSGHRLIGLDQELAGTPEGAWLAAAPGETALRTNSVASLAAAARAGTGIAVLPTWVAGTEPGLVQLFDTGVRRELFWVVHRELQSAGRVRAVAAWVQECLEAAGLAARPVR